MLAAALSFSSVSPSTSRSTVTKLSPAFSAAFSAASNARASSGARYTCPAPPPETFGSLFSAPSVAFRIARELPPARSIRPPARPSLSSSSAFSRCSGENCWWPSRIASDCADWMKTRARSVYFSIFIAMSLSLPLRPERDQQKRIPVLRPRSNFKKRMIWSPNRPHFGGSCARHEYSIFIGFPQAALTFLNQPAVSSPTLPPACGKCGKRVSVTEEVISQIRVRWHRVGESPKKPDVLHRAHADRQHLSLSRQGPLSGAAAVRRAGRRPDASGRPPLCHRKWPQRLRCRGTGVDAEILFPDADARRSASTSDYDSLDVTG